jgi:hypothetical protein
MDSLPSCSAFSTDVISTPLSLGFMPFLVEQPPGLKGPKNAFFDLDGGSDPSVLAYRNRVEKNSQEKKQDHG